MLNRNTSYPIPNSSHHPRPNTCVNFDLHGVEALLHHHHHHQHPDSSFSGVYNYNFVPATATANAATTLFNNGGGGSVPQPKQQTTTKKDRHSKINTAQGPRDRRVRLSIAIARKFFDLQELLGFDKPSKTLDWLLTKSKDPIQDLQNKAAASGAGSSLSQCELLDFDQNGSADTRRKHRKAAGKEPQTQQTSTTLAKESRAKARARARERTLEKMCINQQLGGARTNANSALNPSSFQCRNVNELEFLQLSAASGCSVKNSTTTSGSINPTHHFPFTNEDLIQESIFIKRKSKNIYNSNCINIPSAANAGTTENWDVFGFTSQSNLHAILDQHRFFTSNSNI